MTNSDPEIRCMECGRVLQPGDADVGEWAALGPDGVSLEEQLTYCPRCWEDAAT